MWNESWEVKGDILMDVIEEFINIYLRKLENYYTYFIFDSSFWGKILRSLEMFVIIHKIWSLKDFWF